jgi:hypothetical protein
MSLSCGKPTNGGHVVEGASLHCGARLYWKTNPSRPQDKELETVLCDECKISLDMGTASE